MKDWAAWARRQRTLNGRDPRVQAIRCKSCNRLRPHPSINALYCMCGGSEFVKTVPYADEIEIAKKLYYREIEEANVYGRIAQDMIQELENEQ